jgi:hypothetical protein
MNNKDLLQITENYLKEYVAPHANLMDEEAQILKKALWECKRDRYYHYSYPKNIMV